MPRITYHINPKPGASGRMWEVQKEGTDRPARVFVTKEEAIKYGREIASNHELGQLIVHGTDGKIEIEWTYGKDPERYPG